jgi:para-nitrobenzyl esterase
MTLCSRALLLSSLVIGVIGGGLPAQADPIRVSGGLVSGTAAAGVQTYKGIPYANPPVGDLRWRAPQPVVPWSGTRVADHFSPICVQPDPLGGHSFFTRLFFNPIEPRSEDCLYLNVWTTATAGDKRPVMVWIPGGGFVGGSAAGEIYDGAEFAKKGVLLVSINYRVSKFGFLASPELSKESDHRVSGNFGLLDQIAALQWVKQNIAAFGGDPGNVTIFGQSAGSSSTTFLMASPLARGLFHRAIGESGGAFAAPVAGSLLGRTLQTLPEAEVSGTKLMAALKVTSLAEMRQKTPWEILAIPSSNRFESSVPINDGYVLPGTTDQIFAEHRQNDVPLMLGSNSDEGSNFPHMKTLASFRDDARQTLGPFADDFLRVTARMTKLRPPRPVPRPFATCGSTGPICSGRERRPAPGNPSCSTITSSTRRRRRLTSTMSKISARTWAPIMAPSSPTCSAISSRMNGRGPRKIATLPAPCPAIG